MKKVLAICLTMVMVVCMGITAWAAPNGFVSSPSGTPAPGIITFDPGHDDCTAELVVTPYPDRDNLSEDLLDLFEKAYQQIIGSGDLSQLVPALKDLAIRLGIDGNLSVSDFFMITASGCDFHEDFINFNVTLDANALEHFVGLIQFNEDGKWELVKDAQIVNGQNLQFTVDHFAPFAIVVDSSVGSLIAPQTGYAVMCVSAVVMVAAAMALGFVLLKNKKTQA